MSRTPVCPPMPAILSTDGSFRILDEEAAIALYGENSELHRMVTAASEDPKERSRRMHTCRECGGHVHLTMNRWCAACRERDRLFDALRAAFLRVGACIALVDAHARALHEAPASVDLTWHECEALAFGTLARIHDRSPHFLPFHDDCGDW